MKEVRKRQRYHLSLIVSGDLRYDRNSIEGWVTLDNHAPTTSGSFEAQVKPHTQSLYVRERFIFRIGVR